MPPTLNYPGVYIEELPSGVHTITGVATSIAAFAGWAPQGSVTEAVMVESWSDFARQFGGLSSGNYLGYSVNQFFANGGQQAYIVRLVATAKTRRLRGVFAATASGIVSTLTLFASSPGQWGNQPQDHCHTLNARSHTLQRAGATGQRGATPTTLENFPTSRFRLRTRNMSSPLVDSDSNYITFIDPTI